MPRMRESNRPHPAAIRRLFWYDHETGEVGRNRSFGTNGEAIKSRNVNGYREAKVTFSGKRRTIPCHQIAYCMVTGEWPRGEVDHVDGDKTNNAWRNLRIASKALNQLNRDTKRRDRRSPAKYRAMKSEVEKLKAASAERARRKLCQG